MTEGVTEQAGNTEQYALALSHARVLLFNPSVYDTRFPWSRWQQPLTLLRLSSVLKRNQCEVRLVDALHVDGNASLRRRRIDVFKRGDVSINYWRFGMLKSQLAAQLRTLERELWTPDAVYIEGGATLWWEGVKEAAELVRERFPQTRVILCGTYPHHASNHAATHVSVDEIVSQVIAGLAEQPVDLSHYPTRPAFSHIFVGAPSRTTTDVLDEIVDKASHAAGVGRVTQFAFADHDVATEYPEQFRTILEGIFDRQIKASFYALGTIHPRTLADDPSLASLMKRAGFKQLVFADDRDEALTETGRERWIDWVQQAVDSCQIAGYRVRTEAIMATMSIGRPGEQVEEVVAHMTRLAHVAGSLIPVPYQPLPEECPDDMPLERQNGKIFPFAEHNGVSYREYQDVIGLAALFNSKYRSRTFDFAGDSLVSKLVQDSLTNGRWNPHNMPGGLPERPITVGWFNKEGKWVRS